MLFQFYNFPFANRNNVLKDKEKKKDGYLLSSYELHEGLQMLFCYHFFWSNFLCYIYTTEIVKSIDSLFNSVWIQCLCIIFDFWIYTNINYRFAYNIIQYVESKLFSVFTRSFRNIIVAFSIEMFVLITFSRYFFIFFFSNINFFFYSLLSIYLVGKHWICETRNLSKTFQLTYGLRTNRKLHNIFLVNIN